MKLYKKYQEVLQREEKQMVQMINELLSYIEMAANGVPFGVHFEEVMQEAKKIYASSNYQRGAEWGYLFQCAVEVWPMTREGFFILKEKEILKTAKKDIEKYKNQGAEINFKMINEILSPMGVFREDLIYEYSKKLGIAE
jgi:hypothetical protein